MASLSPFVKHALYKALYYALTWFVAVSFAWFIPRLLPYNAVEITVASMERSLAASGSMVSPQEYKEMVSYIEGLFGANEPLWLQYVNFWKDLLHGNLRPLHSVLPSHSQPGHSQVSSLRPGPHNTVDRGGLGHR
jgi:ABC-type dipeptide/oligopeptide/nickel transport systems, permease components